MQPEVCFDSIIEDRIKNEILANAFHPHDINEKWFAYLRENITFPFVARCIKVVDSLPLALIDVVTVKQFSPNNMKGDICVDVEWQNQIVRFPLSHLDWLDADESTRQALTDWQYWLRNVVGDVNV